MNIDADNQLSNINKAGPKIIYKLGFAKQYGSYNRKVGQENVSASILKLSSYISKHKISHSQYSEEFLKVTSNKPLTLFYRNINDLCKITFSSCSLWFSMYLNPIEDTFNGDIIYDDTIFYYQRGTKLFIEAKIESIYHPLK
ncbi:hypothetical protein BJ944DRAFT_227879 [Cunninghamella echinulata]|nr:hypothetical protein BJ944DRAFT_227879 [Cunninghamella echinulata]